MDLQSKLTIMLAILSVIANNASKTRAPIGGPISEGLC